MILQLQPEQISAFWDSFKEIMLRTNPVNERHRQKYLNHVLDQLMSGKFQAWIVFRFNEKKEKMVHALGVTVLMDDVLTGLKTVKILALYGLRPLDDELARESFREFVKYAKNTGCEQVIADTNVERIKELLTLVGAEKILETYTYQV